MHRARFIGLLACGLAFAGVFAGCNAIDSSVLERLNDVRAPTDAGGVRDSGSIKPPCTPGFELCNGKDEDCDGDVDENADVACVQPNAMTVCATEGRCVRLSCDRGWSDCNGTPSDGCEYSIEQSGPCPTCTGPDCEPELDAGEPPDAADDPKDAALDAEADSGDGDGDGDVDACVASAETCDDADNDCDGKTDEGSACDLQRCIETTPSYRGEGCDRCVCEECSALLDVCQRHSDATWRGRCRDVVECYVVETRAGNCPDGDCYGIGNGPCVTEIETAAGGGNIAANCAATTPPTTACMAAGNYRDTCTATVCADECAD